jgi:hypothetical protein
MFCARVFHRGLILIQFGAVSRDLIACPKPLAFEGCIALSQATEIPGFKVIISQASEIA